ncbi:hypothetical protein M3Y94_01009200 [Aphelenchoides besseyi]|nr:hypothetical protein M3Y94_01009200 [Aphelenchoides besseyi]KAI6220471.1 hypothetical protein M3Y95_01043600 [Aphelenchoides besseyi]
MATCEHASSLKVVKSWYVSETKQFWKTDGEEKISPKSVMMVGPYFFYFSWKSCGSSSQAQVYLHCTGTEKYDDFDCYLWAMQSDKRIGGTETEPVALSKGWSMYHRTDPFTIHGKIFFKGPCPECLKNRSGLKRKSDGDQYKVELELRRTKQDLNRWRARAQQAEQQLRLQVERSKRFKDQVMELVAHMNDVNSDLIKTEHS